MPSLAKFFTYVALGFAALAPIASASPTLTSRSSDLTNPVGTETKSLPRRAPEPQTNAERLRRGLGPAPPRRITNRSRLEARQSSTPCTTATGVISVTQTGYAGYISRTPNEFGEYGITADESAALRVSFCTTDGHLFSITTLNGIISYPYLGFFKGYASSNSNIGPSSSNYLYLGGTGFTGPGAIPLNAPNSFTAATGAQETIESSVWNLAADGSLTVSWVNSDGTVPANTIVYLPASLGIVATGNVAAFQSQYGNGKVSTFKFVPDA